MQKELNEFKQRWDRRFQEVELLKRAPGVSETHLYRSLGNAYAADVVLEQALRKARAAAESGGPVNGS